MLYYFIFLLDANNSCVRFCLAFHNSRMRGFELILDVFKNTNSYQLSYKTFNPFHLVLVNCDLIKNIKNKVQPFS